MWKILAVVGSACASFLERYSSELSTVPLGSFVAFDDCKELLSRVMMRTDTLVDELGGDLVEEMRLAIGFESRQEAIRHFFRRNELEVDAILKVMLAGGNDLVLAAAFAKPVAYRSVFAPLADAIRTYLANRKQMCMYDYLPLGLRRMAKYLQYFTPIDHEALPVTPLSKYGHLTLIHDDSLDHRQNFMMEGCILDSSDVYTTRLMDLRAGCAVDLKPGLTLIRVPHQRVLLFSRSGSKEVSVFRSDSIEPKTFTVGRGITGGLAYYFRPERPFEMFVEAFNGADRIFYKVNLDLARPLEIETLEGGETLEIDDSMKRSFLGSTETKRRGSDWLVMSGFGSVVLNTLSVILPLFNLGGGPLQVMSACVTEGDTVAIWQEIERVKLVDRIHALLSRPTTQRGRSVKVITHGVARAVCDVLDIPDIPDDVLAAIAVIAL